MTQITYNNHLQSYTKDNEYIVSVGRCSRVPLNFKDEAVYTAHLIKEKAGLQDIWISYSGGIDSEFLVHTFLAAGINFKVATNVFKNGYNQYDVSRSRKFCNKYGLKLHEFELDVEQFWDNHVEDFSSKTITHSPHFSTHMHLWDQLDGYIVAGHGDPIFLLKKDGWMYRVKEQEDSVYRYAQWRNRDMAPGFYAYTPELLLSFIMEKEISNMFLMHRWTNVDNVMFPKYDVYSKYYDIEHRIKQTGFEKLTDVDTVHRKKLVEMLPEQKTFLQPVDKFIESLWPVELMTEKHKARFNNGS